MKKIAFALFVGILVIGLALYATGQTGSSTPSPDASKNKLVWHKYDEALEIAKQEDKHAFIFFTTSWCGFCKKMEKLTFPDPEVFELMNEEFALAKVDGDSRNKVKVADKDGNMIEMSEKQLTRALGVRGFPTILFIEPGGKGIGPLSGYLTADQFEVALKYVSSKAYESMSFKDFSARQDG